MLTLPGNTRLHLLFAGALLASAFVFPAHAAQPDASPDFSGIWGRNWLFFEQPPTGPGPITSKLRRPDGVMDVLNHTTGDYTASILKPQAAETVKRLGELELSGTAFPNPHSQCWPQPVPYVLGIERGVQVVQKGDEILLLYVSDHQVRHVRMNAPHTPHATPSWMGDSVGHYEGDTLVVDTIGQKVGPLSMIDLYGTPFSSALHVVERYRLIDGTAASNAVRKHESAYGVNTDFIPDLRFPDGRGDIDRDTSKKGLQVEITVDDPGVFTKTWKAVVTYRHVLGEWPESVCVENTREFGFDTNPVPIASKPDF